MSEHNERTSVRSSRSNVAGERTEVVHASVGQRTGGRSSRRSPPAEAGQ